MKPARPRKAKPRQNTSHIPVRSGNNEQTKTTTTYSVKLDGSGGQLVDNNNNNQNKIICSERCSFADDENRQIISSSRCPSVNEGNRLIYNPRCSSVSENDRKMVCCMREESDEAIFHETSGNEESVVYTSRSDDGEVTTVRQTFKIHGTLEKDGCCQDHESLSNNRFSKESLNKHSSKESLLDSAYQGSQEHLCQDDHSDVYIDEQVTKSVSFEDSTLNSSDKFWIKPNDNIKEELQRELGQDEELLREELLRIFDRERLTLGSFFKSKMEDYTRYCRQRELDMEEQSRAEIAKIESNKSREKADMQKAFAEEIAAMTRTFNENRASMENYHKEQIKELREQLAKDQKDMEVKFGREKVELQEKLEAEFQEHLETEMKESEMSSLQEIAKIEEKYEAERAEVARKHALELNEAEMNTRKVKDELEMMFSQEKARLEERIRDLEEQLSQERQMRIQLEALLEDEKTNVSNLDNAKRSETEKLMSELEGLRGELDEKDRVATELSKFEEGIRVNGRKGLHGKLREDFDKIVDEHKQELEKKYHLDKEELQKDKERQVLELHEEKKKMQEDVENEKKKMKEEIDKERRRSEDVIRRNSSGKTMGYSFSQNTQQQQSIRHMGEQQQYSVGHIGGEQQQSIGYSGEQQQPSGYSGEQQQSSGYSGEQQQSSGYSGEQRQYSGYIGKQQQSSGYSGEQQQSSGCMGEEIQQSQQDGQYSVAEQRQQEYSRDSSTRYEIQHDDRRTQYQSNSADYANQQNSSENPILDYRQSNQSSTNPFYNQTNAYTDQGNNSGYPIAHMSRGGQHETSKYGNESGYSNPENRQNKDGQTYCIYPDTVTETGKHLDFYSSGETWHEQPRQDSSHQNKDQARSPKDVCDDKPNQFYISPGSENDLRSQIKQLRSENEGLKAKIEAMEENISLHKKYKAEAKDELERLQNTKDELQSKIEKGRDSDEAKRAKLKADKLEKSLQESEAQRKKFETKIQELNLKLSDAEEKARQTKVKTGDLEDKIRGLSRTSGKNDNRWSYSDNDNKKYSKGAPTGEIMAQDSSPLYQVSSSGGYYGRGDSNKDRPRHQDYSSSTGLYGQKDRSHSNVYGYPEELNQTVGCLENSLGRDDQRLSWKQPDSSAERYSKTSAYSSKAKSPGRHGLSSTPNPLHGSHERLGRSHHKPQETGHKAGRYSSFSATNEPGYNTSSPRKLDGRSYSNDGTPSRHESSLVTKGNREKAVAERDKLVQLIKELKLKVEELQVEKERIDKEQSKISSTRREPIGYSDTKHDLSSSEHADLKSKVEDMQRKIRELADRLKRDSPRNYKSSTQHPNHTGNPSMQDIEYIQDKLQRTGEAISHTHENTDPDVLRRIELEVKAIGDLIRKHCEENGVGSIAVGAAGTSGNYSNVGGSSSGYGGGVTFVDGGHSAVTGVYDSSVGVSGRIDASAGSTFRFDSVDNMKMLQLQMEKQELEMKLNMAKEAMNDYVCRLSEKMECLEESNAMSDATLQELYERNAKLKETLRALEKGQKRSMRQNEELRHQTSTLQNMIGQICKSSDTSFCSQYSTPRQGVLAPHDVSMS